MKDFVCSVEEGAWEIVGDISDREFLTWRAVGGTMSRLNRVFAELGIHHEEDKVPSKVLKSNEEKAKKASAKNATAVAELEEEGG